MAYLGFNRDTTKFLFYCNPAHWIMVGVSFPAVLIITYFKDKIQAAIRQREAEKVFSLRSKFKFYCFRDQVQQRPGIPSERPRRDH